jgi:uncharacterized protein
VSTTRGPSAEQLQAGPTTHLLYLHGFRSSPDSAKARQTAAWVQAHRPDVQWWCPQLNASPKEVVRTLHQGVATWPRDTMAIIGSSLGGFFATVLAEALGCRAVVLNPAVHPARDLAPYIGRQPLYHDPRQFIDVQPSFADELRAMTPAALHRPQHYFAIIAKGDEVLDWREMHARYAGACIKLLEGGDHSLSDYDTHHLPDIVDFLELHPPCA